MKRARLASVGRAFFREERKMFLDILNLLLGLYMIVMYFYFSGQFDKAYKGKKEVKELLYLGLNCLTFLIFAQSNLILWKLNH